MAVIENERLRIEWTSITGAVAASLVGSVDSGAFGQIVSIRLAASREPRVVVDLSGVDYADEPGIVLLEALTAVANIGIVNVSDAIEQAMRRCGRFDGF
jgi:anti-anti-sigma regulatory factor